MHQRITTMKAMAPTSTINITDAPVFDETYGENPSFPVVQELGNGTIHRITPDLPPFDIAKLVKRFGHKVVRSKSDLNEAGVNTYKFVLFRTRGGCFVQWGKRQRISMPGTLTMASAWLVGSQRSHDSTLR